ncbi:2-oxoadipate dioxygenase/decarboxylase HglS [Bartonella sp. LJL80]
MQLVSPDTIRTYFSLAMSEMYKKEVPQYGVLVDLVREVNDEARKRDPELDRRIRENEEEERLDLERHGAIRIGTGEELGTMKRLFAVMGMFPVGYYDLSVAGMPIHSTAFRPYGKESLRLNPFRVFTSLLRTDLLESPALAKKADEILARRNIFTNGCLQLIEKAEKQGGLADADARQFVAEALETFRWHSEATVSAETYEQFRAAHPLVADIVCFKGPHINHLTPRTLDIDAVQEGMPKKGIAPKAVIEGPPHRDVPIFLRQTSFRALQEPIAFQTASGETSQNGTHTARFGEIEQRGAALTPKGRALYDKLLLETRASVQLKGDGSNAHEYMTQLKAKFAAFPDDETILRRERFAYFHYKVTGKSGAPDSTDIEVLIDGGFVEATPITYEDFLPVSAAGIFQSNLGDESQKNFAGNANYAAFKADLGGDVIDSDDLYETEQNQSLEQVWKDLR